MAADISTLSIVVKSDGIKEAAKSLNDLAASAAKASAAIPKVVSETQKEEQATRSKVKSTEAATAAAEKYISKLQLKAQTLGKSAAATAALTAVQRGFSAEAVKQAAEMGAAIDKQKAAMDSTTKSGTLFNNTVKSMISAFILYKSVGFAKSIIEAGDSWAMMAARLKIATGSMENAKVVQQDLFDLAQKIRVPLEDAARLYTRMADPLRMLGKTSGETMQMVEGVALALKLSGATGAEASSVMLQFSQSINAGRLNGAEFNAVAEGSPIILKALEIQTGKTRGELKKMGADGKISVEMLQAAIAKQLPSWRKDFESLPLTVDGALTRIKNAWTKAMGELSKETGVNTGLADTLRILEDLIPTVRDELVGAFNALGKFILENKESISATWDQVKGLTSDVLKLAGAMASVAGESDNVSNGVSGIGLALYTVRLLLAGVQDGITLIGGVAMKVGAVMYQVFTAPMTFAAYAIEVLMDKFKGLLGLFSKGASALGMDSIATQLKGASEYVGGISKDLAARAASASSTADGLERMGDAAISTITKGEGAVQRLLQGEEKVAKAVQVRGKYQESADLEENARKARQRAQAEAAAAEAKKNASATKKAATEAKTIAEAHEKSMVSLNAEMEKQLEMASRYAEVGKGAEKVTANEKKLITLLEQEKVAKTELERLAKAEEISLARRIVAKEKEVSVTERNFKVEQARATLEAGFKVRGQEYEQDLSGAGLGDKAKAQQDKINALNKEYQQQREELDKLKIPDTEEYDRRLANINKYNALSLEQYAKYYDARSKQEQDWSFGASKAMSNYADEANNVGKQTESLFTNAFKSMEDAIVEFTMTGKLSFKDFANSIISEMARIQAKKLVASLMGESSGSGSSGSGLFGSLLSIGMGLMGGGSATAGFAGVGDLSLPADFTSQNWMMPSAKGNAFSSGAMTTKFADGGAFTNGIVSKPTGFNMGLMGEAGPEAIMPLTRTADGSLGVATDGSSSKSGGETMVTYAPVINIDSRTDRAEVEKLVSKSIQMSQAELVERMQRSRRS